MQDDSGLEYQQGMEVSVASIHSRSPWSPSPLVEGKELNGEKASRKMFLKEIKPESCYMEVKVEILTAGRRRPARR